ncbi:MAG: hypothetical protein GY820_19675 [Gammaproteobacteria bacterium]|nr:hypothetical protein [Gammaproteobacteria bacterium]
MHRFLFALHTYNNIVPFHPSKLDLMPRRVQRGRTLVNSDPMPVKRPQQHLPLLYTVTGRGRHYLYLSQLAMHTFHATFDMKAHGESKAACSRAEV